MKSLVLAALLGLAVPVFADPGDDWRIRMQQEDQRRQLEEIRKRQAEQQRQIEEQQRRLDMLRRSTPSETDARWRSGLGGGLGTVGR